MGKDWEPIDPREERRALIHGTIIGAVLVAGMAVMVWDWFQKLALMLS